VSDQPGGWASPAWGEPARPPDGPPAPAPEAYGYLPPTAGTYAWGAPPSPQPGVVPLRPLGVGEILDGAITTIRRYPKVTIGLAALVVTAQQLISVVAQFSTGSVASALTPGSSLNSTTLGRLAASSGSATGLVLLGANFVLGTVLGAVLTGVLMVVVGEAVLGRPVVPADVWRRVRPRVWALLGGSLLAGIAPLAGLLLAAVLGVAIGLAFGAAPGAVIGVALALLMLVPAAYLWGVLSLTTPAIALERLGPVQGLRRSWQLAAPDFWRVWGIRALATVIGSVLSGVISAVFVASGALLVAVGRGSALTGGHLLGLLVITAVGAVLAGAVVQPFLAAVLGLLYVDRRIRGEGLDITLAESARSARPTR